MHSLSQDQVTAILDEVRSGDRSAIAALLPLIYAELRALAGEHFKSERVEHTLQPTALVHNVYLRMVEQTSIKPTNRKHFFALASKLMRELLIDHARARSRQKRGGQWNRLTLSAVDSKDDFQEVDLLILEEVRQELSRVDERMAAIVELRYFGGLSFANIAEVLEVSEATLYREWRLTKAWLAKELAESRGHEDQSC